MVRDTGGARLLQAIGILVMVVIATVIVTKGYGDVSALARDAPDDFWRALAQYLLGNLAGGGRDWPRDPGSLVGGGF